MNGMSALPEETPGATLSLLLLREDTVRRQPSLNQSELSPDTESVRALTLDFPASKPQEL